MHVLSLTLALEVHSKSVMLVFTCVALSRNDPLILHREENILLIQSSIIYGYHKMLNK